VQVLCGVVFGGRFQLNQLMELTRQLIGDVQNQRPLDHMLKVSGAVCSSQHLCGMETCVGGVAQSLGRRSLAGGLSLIYS